MSPDIHIRLSLPTRPVPVLINENLDDEILVPSERACPNRMSSPPHYFSPNDHFRKSIMKWKTLDESLKSTDETEETREGRGMKKNSLQFTIINIREYSRTVGDNPSCSSGPPLSISWEYMNIGEIDVDEYENMRPPRRVQREMILPRNMREDILRYECNASRQEITESIRQNVRIKNQRRTTINNLGKAEKLEEVMESASRKLRRFVTRKKSVHKQVEDLEKEIDVCNRRARKLNYLEKTMSQGREESFPGESTLDCADSVSVNS